MFDIGSYLGSYLALKFHHTATKENDWTANPN